LARISPVASTRDESGVFERHQDIQAERFVDAREAGCFTNREAVGGPVLKNAL